MLSFCLYGFLSGVAIVVFAENGVVRTLEWEKCNRNIPFYEQLWLRLKTCWATS